MPQLTKQRAGEIIQGMRDRQIVVLGDVMLDEFVWGDVTRISPEAPVPVVDIRRESVHLGGAANVLANVIALGAGGCVGGWYSPDRDVYLLEISEIHHVDRDTAVRLGARRNQEAILDLATGEFIPTGGTGDAAA